MLRVKPGDCGLPWETGMVELRSQKSQVGGHRDVQASWLPWRPSVKS